MDPETRAYLDDMRRELSGRFDGIDEFLGGVDQRLGHVDQRVGEVDQRLGGVDQRLGGVDQQLQGVDRRFDGVDQRFDRIDRRFLALEAELRRHFDVLIEQIRHELQVVAKMVVANTESIAAPRLRLDTR